MCCSTASARRSFSTRGLHSAECTTLIAQVGPRRIPGFWLSGRSPRLTPPDVLLHGFGPTFVLHARTSLRRMHNADCSSRAQADTRVLALGQVAAADAAGCAAPRLRPDVRSPRADF